MLYHIAILAVKYVYLPDKFSWVETTLLILMFIGAAACAVYLEISFSRRLREAGVNVIARPPGSRFLSALRLVFSRKTCDEIFAQVVNDERQEHVEALANGRDGHARWISIRLNITLGVCFATWLFTSVLKRGYDMWKMN